MDDVKQEFVDRLIEKCPCTTAQSREEWLIRSAWLAGHSKGSRLRNTTSGKVPHGFNPDTAIKVLEGDLKSLNTCFNWATTDQGFLYWSEIAKGFSPLKGEAPSLILEWMRLYYLDGNE